MQKILLVEDEVDILDITTALLKDSFKGKIELFTAQNGLDAFLISQKEKFKLIITDHKMPFMTGAAFIIACRTKETLNQQTPIIMLSSYMDDKLKKNLGIQNVKFIDKPFDKPELIRTVTSYLN